MKPKAYKIFRAKLTAEILAGILANPESGYAPGSEPHMSFELAGIILRLCGIDRTEFNEQSGEYEVTHE